MLSKEVGLFYSFGSAGDVESELIASSHTNVLLLKQIFVQAQKWHLNLDADLDELENRQVTLFLKLTVRNHLSSEFACCIGNCWIR